ncbi:MAG: single-stranded DNA-binding protein [Kibdelosporangium sp.]
MAWNETRTTVVGRIMSDVRTRTTTDGQPMAFFGLISSSRKYDQATGTWVDASKIVLSVKCFRRLAENVAAALRKGDPVVVTGRLSTAQFEIGGQLREEIELEASCIGPDLSLCEADLRRADKAAEPVGAVAA